MDPNLFLSSLGTLGTYYILLDVMLETLEERLNRWYHDERSWKHKASTRLSFRKAQVRNMPKAVDRKKMMERIRTVVMDVADALEYLHEHNIIFQDLKPENIGFEIETDELKIFDFGMARSVDPETGKIVGEEEEMICGTPRYFAPEIFDFSGGSKQTDVYAFGIMLHEICSMSVPFKDMEEFEDFRDHICAGLRPNMYDIPDEATREVIKDCTLEDPAARPSFSELRGFRLPELLVEKMELESPTTRRRSSADLFKRPSITMDGDADLLDTSETDLGSFSVIPFDLGGGGDMMDIFNINRPQHHDDFDDYVPRRSSASNNASMPRMRYVSEDDEDDSVNSREDLGRSMRSASSDFGASSAFMLSSSNNDNPLLTEEQKQRRQERLKRKLDRKKKPKRRKLKKDKKKKEAVRRKKKNKGVRRKKKKEEPKTESKEEVPKVEEPKEEEPKEPRQRSVPGLEDMVAAAAADADWEEDMVSLSDDILVNLDIPRDLSYDDAALSLADEMISLDDDTSNDYTISLNDEQSMTSRDRADDDFLREGGGAGGGTEEAETPTLLPPPPPPPLPNLSPKGGLDSSSHGTSKKKRRKKKKGLMDVSAHSVATADDNRSVASGPGKRNGQLDTSQHATKKTRKKKKKGMDNNSASAHSALSSSNTVSLADDDAALENGPEHEPPPPPPPLPPNSPQQSRGRKTSRRKKKGMDLSSHSAFGTTTANNNKSVVADDTRSVKSAEEAIDDVALLDGLTPRSRRQKKKKLGKNKKQDGIQPASPTKVGTPKKTRTPKNKSRKKNKLPLEMKLLDEPQLSQPPAPVLLDDDPTKIITREDTLPFLSETTDAMLQKGEICEPPTPTIQTMPPREFSWWTLKICERSPLKGEQ
mmetsp:Transcript_36832/g.89465  ORF Transcript_36832/g.89465 Transcript_36832/m.89465 type:complete len:876 (+) Transcript_36832:3-2630(+)